MAVACLLGRSALETAGVGMAGRAALTIGSGSRVYVPALWWLAPESAGAVFEIGGGASRSS